MSLSIPSPDPRSLTVCCYAGLANRLRVLVSSLALAEATGRQFSMLWPRTSDCGAAFEELFEGEPSVVVASPQAIGPQPTYGGWFQRPVPDILRATEPHISLCTTGWLTMPQVYPHHRPLHRRAGEILSALRPVAVVRDQVHAFQAARFRPKMIGVHLRRGDFNRAQAASAQNTAEALSAIEQYLKQVPESGIFLCSDDGAPASARGGPWREGVRELLAAHFGDRLVTTRPRSFDRTSRESIQDALVDLLLLRATQYVVGTEFSSFSELACFGRLVPSRLCRSGRHAGLRRLAVASGVYGLFQSAMRRRYGQAVPATVLFYEITARPRVWLRPMLQRRLPGLYRWLRGPRGPEHTGDKPV